EIPFARVERRSSRLHCAFGLEHVDPTRQQVYQNHYTTSRQWCTLSASKNDLPRFESAVPSTSMLASSRVGIHADRRQTVFRLPPRLRGAICRLLERPVAAAATGGCLVACLAWSGWAGQLAGRPSPTDCLLDLWEARCRGEEALIELADSLKAMGSRMQQCYIIAALSCGQFRVAPARNVVRFHSSSPAAVVAAWRYQRVGT
uniref:Calpain catalytic domain-containing protein n=1 Tax=Macrostomum lignano TaxID=282301 RepID=A0A1I8FIE0_9PLAT